MFYSRKFLDICKLHCATHYQQLTLIRRQFLSSTTACNQRLKYLTSAQKEQYDNDGYTMAKNLLTGGEVEEAKNALAELIERSRYVNESNNIFEVKSNHTFEAPCLNRVRFPSEHHHVFAKLLKHSLLLDCVEDLIGDSFRYMPQDKLNVKPAGGGAAIPWHQDWAFFPHTNDSVITASYLFYDVTRENGCLQVIAGSHKGPTYSHHHNCSFVSVITDKNVDYSNVHYLEGPAGSVTFHNARIIHGSARNESNIPRSTLCNIFTAMDAWPLLGVAGKDFMNTGPVDFDKFDETRVRGKPCMQPRMENVPVILPTPFTDDSTVFDLKFDYEEPKT